VEVLRSNGKVTGLKCVQCEAQSPDQTGRIRTLPKAEAEVVLPAQTILFAGVQEPDLEVLNGSLDLRQNAWNLIEVNPASLATSEPGIFAAGDVTTGGATAIEAIAAGQKAAVAIHRYLRGMEQREPYRLVKPRRRVDSAEAGEAFENFKRPQEALRPASERAHDFREADVTFSEMLAVCEAKRCLHCDLD
jgi:NADH-quinone oxidoreductase subunit F